MATQEGRAMGRNGSLGFTEQAAGRPRPVCGVLACASQPIYMCDWEKHIHRQTLLVPPSSLRRERERGAKN